MHISVDIVLISTVQGSVLGRFMVILRPLFYCVH